MHAASAGVGTAASATLANPPGTSIPGLPGGFLGLLGYHYISPLLSRTLCGTLAQCLCYSHMALMPQCLQSARLRQTKVLPHDRGRLDLPSRLTIS